MENSQLHNLARIVAEYAIEYGNGVQPWIEQTHEVPRSKRAYFTALCLDYLADYEAQLDTGTYY